MKTFLTADWNIGEELFELMQRPFRAVAAAMLFGFSTALAYRLPAYSGSLPGIAVLVQALPYVLTLIAVAGVIGRSIPPAAVGRPYKKQ